MGIFFTTETESEWYIQIEGLNINQNESGV